MLKQVVATVTRLGRSAASYVTRDPLLAALVAILVAALLYGYLSGKLLRENWEFQPNGKKPPSKVRKLVKQRCKSGMYFSQFTNDPKYEYMAKYDQNALWKACNSGYGQHKKGLEVVDTITADQCKSKKLCENISMRATRPCQNSKGKCCKRNGHECVDPNLAGASNFNYLKDKRAAAAAATTAAPAATTAAPAGGGGSSGECPAFQKRNGSGQCVCDEPVYQWNASKGECVCNSDPAYQWVANSNFPGGGRCMCSDAGEWDGTQCNKKKEDEPVPANAIVSGNYQFHAPMR